jgi:hypothetical protein
MKNILFIFLNLTFLIAFNSHAQSVESLLQDLNKGPTSTSLFFTQLPNTNFANKTFKMSKVVQEFRMYKYNNQELPLNYMSSFIQHSRRDLFQKQAQWIKQGRCDLSASGEVLNGKKFIKQESFSAHEVDIIDSFESSLIKIEATGCVKADSPLKVFNEYIKADFQKQAIAELKSSEIVADTICEKTEVFGIGKSHYCYDVSVNYDEEAEVLTLHTYNVGNAPRTVADAPVYFREIVATFKKLSNGQVGVSFFVYVRGADVPALARSIARSKIKETQLRLFKLLNERVR